MQTQFLVQNIFREVFDDDGLVVVPETSPQDLPGWDSVAQVKLVLAIEDQFDIHFTTDEVSSIKCVGDFLAAIGRHRGEAA